MFKINNLKRGVRTQLVSGGEDTACVRGYRVFDTKIKFYAS